MRPNKSAILGLAIAALFTAACFRPSDNSGQPDASPTPETSGSQESLEGRFSYDTMDEYVSAVLPLITPWLRDTWPDVSQPRRVLYVPNGAEGPEGCVDANGDQAAYTSESYEYCGVDNVVYVGQDLLWDLYTKSGDAGPAVGLAHEFGHHVQQTVGVPSPRSTAESVRYEDQADCIAGSWTRYTEKANHLELPDDLRDIEALFPLIGSAEGSDHGTARERANSFQRGFDGGAQACNAFYPSTPIV